jgi:xanthine/uracil/vitamin C permease (AzgA family)
VSLAIPIELILAVGIGIDLLLAYMGFNLFKVIRNKLRARSRTGMNKAPGGSPIRSK